MIDREKVIKGLECCLGSNDCDIEPEKDCPYKGMCLCAMALRFDVLELLKEQDEEHRRLLSWLGKFCRHIDNGDAWLTDEENIAFFKEKMKQQFGWDTD